MAEPAIIHLHGQSSGLVLLNSTEDINEHRKRLRPILSETVNDCLTVVIGYSGSADGAF
ncbi:MAG: hypothetical protein QNK92_04990 [Amylibacter sp.]